MVSGDYMAHGGESYIIIGNFSNSSNSTYDTVSNVFNPVNATYLFIDNVSLTLSACTSIENLGNKSLFEIYPNPAQDYLSIKGAGINSVSVVDLRGQMLITDSENHSKIDVFKLSGGIYIIKVETDKGRNYI